MVGHVNIDIYIVHILTTISIDNGLYTPALNKYLQITGNGKIKQPSCTYKLILKFYL